MKRSLVVLAVLALLPVVLGFPFCWRGLRLRRRMGLVARLAVRGAVVAAGIVGVLAPPSVFLARPRPASAAEAAPRDDGAVVAAGIVGVLASPSVFLARPRPAAEAEAAPRDDGAVVAAGIVGVLASPSVFLARPRPAAEAEAAPRDDGPAARRPLHPGWSAVPTSNGGIRRLTAKANKWDREAMDDLRGLDVISTRWGWFSSKSSRASAPSPKKRRGRCRGPSIERRVGPLP